MSLSSDTIVAAPMAFASGPHAVSQQEGKFTPAAPTSLSETGVESDVLLNLALKLAYTVPRFTTRWAAEKLCLPVQLVAEIGEQLRVDQLVEVLGQVGPFDHRFTITGQGRQRAQRLLEISGYVGPAPVSLESYNENLQWQFNHLPQPTDEQIQHAVSELVLPEDVVEVAGLAMMSRRSLFLYGPPGNGKTSLGHLLHDAVAGDFWIPYCISIGENIIRVFDRECHEPVADGATSAGIDRRWVRIQRPFVVVGGELTTEALDLIYSPNLGYYEAPLHFKANGGTFLLDDFGCQRVEPEKLLNRWIHPLDRGVDFLTLQTGQQLEVPFRQMLIVSTNLDVDTVMTPAFLRRMGYRLQMNDPSPELYMAIFHRYAERGGAKVPDGLVEHLLDRYQAEGRALHSCEPRDLIERARDICHFRGQPLQLSTEIADLAWRCYFGNGR